MNLEGEYAGYIDFYIFEVTKKLQKKSIHRKRFLANDWLEWVGDAVACAYISSAAKLRFRLWEVRLEGYQEFCRANVFTWSTFIDINNECLATQSRLAATPLAAKIADSASRGAC